MNIINIIGWIATVSTVIRLFPQLFLTLKTKKTDDLSLTFLLIAVLGNINWIIFGAFKNNIQLLTNDCICMSLNSTLIILKLYYDKKNKKKLNYKCDISGN